MTTASIRQQQVSQITHAMTSEARPLAIQHARKVDASGICEHFWMVSDEGRIVATGTRDDDLASAIANMQTQQSSSSALDKSEEQAPLSHISASGLEIVDAQGATLTPGYIDIHSHGAWEHSFDDGEEAIAVARAGHAVHGTTRQVLSLITNPLDVMCNNLRTVAAVCAQRPDCIGAHLEGPFLAVSRKGAHDPDCLREPQEELVEQLLEAAHGCIRQITIAPELPHGIEAIARFRDMGVIPAIGHSDADYVTTKRGIDAGAGILTHIFNAMNGIGHRQPGPIPAVLEDSRVQVELINDGFHVHNPVVELAFKLFPHRLALITDSMAATGCADGRYTLGKLAVNVENGHARLLSNGAIAGSTLTLDIAVRRAIEQIGISEVDAVDAATLGPAHALELDRPNQVTAYPLGLLSAGYAADALLMAPQSWRVASAWCQGRRIVV
jgi:N-acetylglucosamine-6-phosphate deacetylase